MKLSKIMCYVIAVLIILQMLPAAVLASNDFQVFESNGRNVVYMSGNARIYDGKYYGKTANLISYDSEGGIKAVEQTKIDADGSFEFKFVLTGSVTECNYMIRAGADNITRLVNTVYADNNNIEYTINVKNIDGEDYLYVEENMSVQLKIKNKFSFKDRQFQVIVAQYGGEGELVDIALLSGSVSGDELNTEFVYDDLIANSAAVSVRVFVFNNLNELTPLGEDCYKIVSEKTENKIYVSADGDDNNSGGFLSPVKTVSKAAEYATSLAGSGKPICIILSHGTYYADDLASLSSFISGNTASAVTVMAKKGEEVVFSNEKIVDSSLITSIKDETVLSAIPSAVANKCVQIDVSSLDTDNVIYEINDTYLLKNDYVFAPIYINDRRQKMSVWPNSGYIDADGGVEKGSSVVDINWSANRINEIKNGGGSIPYIQAELDNWKNISNGFVTGYLSNDYWGEVIPIAELDTQNKKIKLGRYSTYGLADNARWRITNVPEAIDLPGEYYIDPDKKIIYLYPDEEISSNDKITLMGNSNTIIDIGNAADISFEGIIFDKTYGTALNIINSSNVTVTDCVFKNIGECGIAISNSKNINIDSCLFYNNEKVPLTIKRCGDVAKIEEAKINISNNIFYNSGLQNYNRMIDIDEYTCGVDITQNTISGTTSGVIFSQGTNVDVSYNEIYNVAKNSFDCGVVETGRMFTIYDNTIEYNYIHDFGGDDTSAGRASVNGIFLDDMVSGQIVRYNLIVPNNKNRTGGIKIGGGSDNKVQYNTVVGAANSLIVESRLSGKEDDSIFSNQIWTRISNNIDYSAEPWITQHPGVSNIISRIKNEKTYRAKDNNVTDNVSYGCDGSVIDPNPQKYGVINEFTDITDYTNSIFSSADNQDYRLKDELAKKYGLTGVLTDSTDIDLIGSSLSAVKEKNFALNYPLNYGMLDMDNCWLNWQNADFADEYEVVVAENYELSKIVERKTTTDNCAKFDNLQKGKKYYWTVYAKNISRKNSASWNTNSGVYCFSVN